MKDREEDARLNILPSLENGKVVVMDRYIYSNIAYQGALGIDIDLIDEKNKNFPVPDMVFFLDAPPEKGIGRINDARTGGTNIGYETADYLKKVYELYRRPEFNFMVTVDADRPVDTVQKEIMEKVFPLLA